MECHECGATISEKAADCPYCGTSVSAPADRGQDDADRGHDGDDGGPPPDEPAASGQGFGQSSGSTGRPATGSGETDQPEGADWFEGAEPTAGGLGSDEEWASGGEATTDEPTGETGGLLGDRDPAAIISGLPYFPGAAAGFAVGAVTFGLAVAFRAAMPVGSVTFGESAVVLFDLHFGTVGRVTPGVFDHFEVARPPDASLGFLYLVPPLALYAAGKGVVAFNVDESAPLLEAVLAGATVVLGYAPVVALGFLLVPPDPPAQVSLAGALAVAPLCYPLLFGALGGLVAGTFSGRARRVNTVYALGAFFVLVLGTFLSSFLFISDPTPAFDAVSRLLVTLFAVMGTTVLSLARNSAVSVLPLVFVVGSFGAAGFVRVWRLGPGVTPARGFATGAAMAPTYTKVTGLAVSLLMIPADDYVQSDAQLDMAVEATIVVNSVVSAGLNTVGEYVAAVLTGTVAYAVLTGGLAGLLAAAIRGRDDDSATADSAHHST